MLRIVLLVLPLAACSGLDQSACPGQDFESIGRSEALRGAPVSLPAPGCALNAAQQTAYARGREEGLRRYCTAARGYVLGLDGQAIAPDLCSEDDRAELARGHEVGSTLRFKLGERDQLLAQAREIERAAEALNPADPHRRQLDDDAATARAQARQHDNDIEALRGIAAVERWR